jgi:hypothetical protein
MLLFLALNPDLQVSLSCDDTVYHVANPDVAGKVNYKSGSWVGVTFEEPVYFTGNPDRGFAKFWECSENLLFPTSAEAWKHKKY